MAGDYPEVGLIPQDTMIHVKYRLLPERAFTVFSSGPFSIVAPYACLQQPYFFDVVTKIIDVATNSTQTKSTC